jgi:hypothetical protein
LPWLVLLGIDFYLFFLFGTRLGMVDQFGLWFLTFHTNRKDVERRSKIIFMFTELVRGRRTKKMGGEKFCLFNINID